jgi:hypothetical protein
MKNWNKELIKFNRQNNRLPIDKQASKFISNNLKYLSHDKSNNRST